MRFLLSHTNTLILLRFVILFLCHPFDGRSCRRFVKQHHIGETVLAMASDVADAAAAAAATDCAMLI